ncbi:Cation efflux protein [Kalmanozyma brasiliensis GHG001]|uniref:Cation efflux protein n=1 Tax=Kalmanozyma brasiliensis (strain GHG001) TaxID=1365824 RepID=UPI001CE9DFBE|nr:Cation efflux protein [Kalmanozyma brasiliensis GHG001]KAF6767208.1 Cation efflux protein [Kalmanozyma brasiliensis GHG001]
MQSPAYNTIATPDSRTRAKVRMEPVTSPSRPSGSSAHTSSSSLLGFPIPTDLLLGLLLNKTLLASAALLVRAWLASSHSESIHLQFSLDDADSTRPRSTISSSASSWAIATSAFFIAASLQAVWFKAWQWLPAVKRVDKRRLCALAAISFAQLLVWLMALHKLDAVNVIIFTQYCEIWAVDLARSLRGRSYGGYTTLFALAISFLSSILNAGAPLAANDSFSSQLLEMYADNDLPDSLRRNRPADLASPSQLRAASAAVDVSVANFSVFGTLTGHAYLLIFALLTIERESALLSASRDTGGRRKAGIVATIVASAFTLPASLLFHLLGFSTLPALSSLVSSSSGGSSGSSTFNHLPAYLAISFGFLILEPLVSTSIESHASTKDRVAHGWPIAVLASFGIGFVGFGLKPQWSQIIVALLVGQALRTVLKHSPDHVSSRFASSSPSKGDVAQSGGASTKSSDISAVQELVDSFRSGAAATRRTIKIILANPDSRKIFQFLMLNLAFMGVQLLWGVWTNSLGLISDAIHMFFDCAAIGMGLFASVMATWPTDSTFTYGYGRVETLSGFANGIFLILISVFIVFEAVQRIIEPPVMNNNTQLLIVSSMGLGVNLFGMWATGGHHHHGHSHGHGHDHGHGHGHDHGHGHSHNMMGVYLHVMADTLGSVGVIISTLLIGQFGWTGFDPIASLFIAFMIVGSVIPLVLESGRILCLEVGAHRETEMTEALDSLRSIDGVVSYHSPRFWPKDAETLIGVIRVQISWPVTGSTAYDDGHQQAHEHPHGDSRGHNHEHSHDHGHHHGHSRGHTSEDSGAVSKGDSATVTPEAIAKKVENMLKSRIHGLESVAVQLEKVGAGIGVSPNGAFASTPMSASPSYSSTYDGSPTASRRTSEVQGLSPAVAHRHHHQH